MKYISTLQRDFKFIFYKCGILKNITGYIQIQVKLKSEVFNNSIGSPYSFGNPTLTIEQDQLILAGLFEQLMIFDKIVISTNRLNFALLFLIDRLGINTVERLFDSGYIKLMIWSPLITSGTGRILDDGSKDESVIYNQPPIIAGTFSDEEMDPEKNIQKALSYFNLNRDRKRIFTKRVSEHYIVPDGMNFAKVSTKLIMDAYKSDSLKGLGLPFEKEPNLLDLDQRKMLMDLGHKVLETAILAKYTLKSYENFEHFEICNQNISKIGKAYNVSNNSNTLFELEGLPNLRALYLQENIDFDDVFKLRHISNAKYYRKWINDVGENCNAVEISKEYLNEIKGKSNFFESNQGKLIKTLTLFGISTALGVAIKEPTISPSGLALGLMESFWLESILKGKSPSIFIDTIKNEIQKKM